MEERLLKFFPERRGIENANGVSEIRGLCRTLALALVELLPMGPERTLALRSLIAAQDDALRALET